MYETYTEQAKQYSRDAKNKYDITMRQIGDPDPHTMKFLEVGCGCGFALGVFRDAGMEVLGIDPSEYMARRARQQLDLDCLVDTVEDYDGDSEHFDLVASWGTSMNFYSPVDAYIKIHSLLKAKGVFVFDFFDADSPFYFLTRRKRRKGVHVTGCPSKRAVEVMLRRAGFLNVWMVDYTPVYSMSFIGTQLDSRMIKWISRLPVLNAIGVRVPVVGTKLVFAEKAP
jgi:SAM-dependent methyltransferase